MVPYSNKNIDYRTVTHTSLEFIFSGWNLMEFSILNVGYGTMKCTVISERVKYILVRTLTQLNPTYVLKPVPVLYGTCTMEKELGAGILKNESMKVT